MTAELYICFFLISAVAAGFFIKNGFLLRGAFLDKLIALSVFLAVLLIGLLVVKRVFRSANSLIDAYRLAWFISPLYGYNLYSGPANGPAIAMIYGPVAALFYMPVGFIRPIIPEIFLAPVLSLCYFFLPAAWLFFKGAREKQNGLLTALYSFICFCLWALWSPALMNVCSSVHVDPPALGLGMLSCVLLIKNNGKGAKYYVLSSLSCVLSVWAKQIFLPLLLALPFYVFWAHGFKNFMRYVLFLLVSFVSVSGIILLLFGPGILFFHMFEIPLHTSLRLDEFGGSLLKSVMNVAGRLFFSEGVRPLIILTGISVFQWKMLKKEGLTFQAWLQANPWVVFFVVSVFLLFPSILGRIKEGGCLTTLNPVMYFFYASMGLAIMDFTRRVFSLSPGVVRKAGKVLMVLFMLRMIYINFPVSFSLDYELNGFKNNETLNAYRYSKKHPDQAYFPNSPLATLLADGKLYHHSIGLWERRISGFPLSQQHFDAYIPKNIKMFAYKQQPEIAHEAKRYLPGFTKRLEIKQLPDWQVYIRTEP